MKARMRIPHRATERFANLLVFYMKVELVGLLNAHIPFDTDVAAARP